jgi:hypothetical protein
MKSNVFSAESATNKELDRAIRFSFAARSIIQIIAVLSALLALLAAAQFIGVVAKSNELLAQTLWITAAQKGKAFGDATGLLVIAAIFSALSWTLFRLSRQTNSELVANQASIRVSRFRKLTLTALGLLAFGFAVLVVSFAVETVLGAIAITTAQGDKIDHSLLRLGYIHELHFWLPLGSLLACLASAATCNLIRRRMQLSVER